MFDAVTHDPQTLAYHVLQGGIENLVLRTDLPYDMAMLQPTRAVEEVADSAAVQRIANNNAALLYGR